MDIIGILLKISILGISIYLLYTFIVYIIVYITHIPDQINLMKTETKKQADSEPPLKKLMKG